MGLFHKEKLLCACCGQKVNKYDTQISGGDRICFECDIKVKSDFVKNNIKKEDYYPYTAEQMKELQKVYEVFAERKKQFVVDYYENVFYIDKEHGWFIICASKDEIAKKNVQKHYPPIEIFSINDVEKIVYGVSQENANAKINFRFRNNPFPWDLYRFVPIERKFLEGHNKYNQRIEEIVSPLKKYFTNTQFMTFEEENRLALNARLQEHCGTMLEDIYTLTTERDNLNNSLNSMAQVLPDNCKNLANRYIILEKELSKNIEVLKNINNFHSVSEMVERTNECYSYLKQMSELFNTIFLKAAKRNKKS